MPEAERDYQLALEADARSATALAGLAQVRERSGENDEARKSATASVQIEPTAAAYLVLGRVALAAGDQAEAKKDLEEARKLEPDSAAVQRLEKDIQSAGATKKE